MSKYFQRARTVVLLALTEDLEWALQEKAVSGGR